MPRPKVPDPAPRSDPQEFPAPLLQPLLLSLSSATPRPPGSLAAAGAAFSAGGGPKVAASGGIDALPPLSGSLYVQGSLGGSAAQPQGELVLRLLDGAVGPTRLANAEASAVVSAARRVTRSGRAAHAARVRVRTCAGHRE